MKRMIAFLMILCLAAAAAAYAENAAEDCTGGWYFVYADVTIGDLDLKEDGSYHMALYSQEGEVNGNWTRGEGTVVLTPEEGTPSEYALDGSRMLPLGVNINFEIRREPGRITDLQLGEYVQNETLPEGMTGEELQEIIQGVYDLSEREAQQEKTFGDFIGVWVNSTGGYLTIWDENVTGAFPADGDIQTGYYGEPGKWTRDGNVLVNTDGTILVLKSDGGMICAEENGTFAFTRVLAPSEAAVNPGEEQFLGDWKSAGIMFTNPEGVKIFTAVDGYNLRIGPEAVYTLFGDDISEHPYRLDPEKGMLSLTAGDETDEYVLYGDGSIRWALSDNITVVFKAAEPGDTIRLYSISGPEYVPADTSAQYTVNELAGHRNFTWSTEGEGVTIDPETGVLTVSGTAAPDTPFTVTAAPAGGEPPVTMTGFVSSGLFTSESFETYTPSYGRGFGIPVAASWGTSEKTESKKTGTVIFHHETDQFICDQTASVIRLDYYPEPAAYFGMISEKLKAEETYRKPTEKTAEINGTPVYMMCFETGEGETASGSAGYIYAIRENTILVMTIVCGKAEEYPTRITISDLEAVAGGIAFDPEKAPVRREDGELTVSAKGDQQAVQAGKKIQVSASFANPRAVKGDNADALTWTVTDQETGEAPEGITFDGKGTLSVSKNLTAKKTVVVTAASEMFGTSASCTVIAVPVIRGIAADPKTVTLYSDSDDSAAIRITAGLDISPEEMELSWTDKPKGIAEIIPENDGTFTLKALAAGSTTVTFTEAGGKTASVKVSVMQPVQSMKLSSSGNPVPGGTVKAAADIKPGNAGNRKVVWSLDVGEDIATVNDYGRIKINRNAPIGTVITVTCTANGAKEPLVETMQLEVTGK